MACYSIMISTPLLTYRTIDADTDAQLCWENQRDACFATFGNDRHLMPRHRHLRWLREKIEEFPDGFVLAFQDDQCIGELQLQVPYGLSTGYINLYHVRASFRGKGYGRLLHACADRYFRSWEATRIELHVSPTNQRAIRFYRAMGYQFVRPEGRLWLMAKE